GNVPRFVDIAVSGVRPSMAASTVSNSFYKKLPRGRIEMSQLPLGLTLPKSLDQIDAGFMTKVLRHNGVISSSNEVVAQGEEGDSGDKAKRLTEMGVDFWASDTNIAIYKYVMPGGAKIFDKFTTLEGSSVVGSPTWDRYLGGPGICEMFTRKIDAFFQQARP